MAKAAAKAKAHTKKGKPVKKKKVSTGAETNLVRRVTLKPTKEMPGFASGDTVVVHVKVKEGEKERIQAYKGVVIKMQGSGASRSFTVRKISAGVGVERTFPYTSPAVDRVELIATGKVRRAKLYYLRELDGKAAKIQSEIAVPTAQEAQPAATAE